MTFPVCFSMKASEREKHKPWCHQQTGKQVRDANSLPNEWLTEFRKNLATDSWLKMNSRIVTQRWALMWKGSKLYVPAMLRDKVLHQCHDVKTAGHFGFVKTLHLVRCQLWWPKLRKQVEDYVRGCPICVMAKPLSGKPLGLLQSVAEPCRP